MTEKHSTSAIWRFSVAPMMHRTDRAEQQSAISTSGELDEPRCTKR
jgi:hypothetical protein